MLLTQNQIDCFTCGCQAVRFHKSYSTQEGDPRHLYYCSECNSYFSQTKGTPLPDLKTPISRITLILNSLNEGQGINAVCRVFGVSKASIYRWQERLSQLKPTLLLYSLCHQFFQLLIEGDELYTKIKKTFLQRIARAGHWF